MKKLLITIFALFALMSASSYAMAEEGGIWEQTKTGANKAIEWTVQKSRQGWQATKEGAADLAAWTGNKASSAWDALQKVHAWTEKKSKQGWEATKQIALDAGKRLSRKIAKVRESGHLHSKGMTV